mgnify:CR=1 FL=1
MNKNGTSPILAICRDESDRQLSVMRQIAKEMFGDHTNYLIGVNGSVARRECTSGSDVDLFFLINGKVTIADAKVAQTSYRERLEAEGLKMPSHGGVFENPLKIASLLKTIGGDKDTNEFITRRMLFLLEGEWTFTPLGEPGANGQFEACKVNFSLTYAFASNTLAMLVGPVFDKIAATMVEAFVARADATPSGQTPV